MPITPSSKNTRHIKSGNASPSPSHMQAGDAHDKMKGPAQQNAEHKILPTNGHPNDMRK